ncbi:nitrate- and nitrite sensing domain-containing protein [Streptomyces sp. DSM 42041]|uniref:histidine kinase n=1 Tax=Streptomyces hazeniae TaxID=3075538 RepID=A0ABU2NPZ1_9ACTN|nr:nitrate- and nitrite sensing domain-containing protein [Streptomyces sp. DSM 42041]MDT0379049.1 nitrate- and nitrite sensing domain-containing protein [Streptomyces sp. DSM 42041]
MRISQRLVLLVSVPLAVTVTFSGLALAPATSQAVDAHRLTDMVRAAQAASDLAHDLQRERSAATVLVADGSGAASFRKRAEATDDSAARFSARRAALDSLPEKARGALDRVAGALSDLPSLRAQARSGSSSLSALVFRYRILIADLVSYRDGIAQAEGVRTDIADRIHAVASLSRAGESLGQQQVTVLRALSGGGFTPASKQTFDATRLDYDDAVRNMYTLGPAEWRTLLERRLSGSRAVAARRLEDQAARSGTGEELTVSGREWSQATSERLELLQSVESRVDDALLDSVASERNRLTGWAVGEALLVVAALVGAVVFALRLGRVMIHRLRDLRNAAHEVAHHGLPETMRELSRPGALTGTTPEKVAERNGSPLPADGGDEIAELGEAFNAVHYETIRLAAQRTRSHERFAETLVGVARRGGQLTSVMVSELDAVQRDESDPERMKVLFALDHLAVRMERNTNSLLVLAGHGQGRVRASDVPCSSVIVAAAQQTEQFNRVSVGAVDDIHIAARVVHDLAHLLAELLDNATRFSPPDTEVGVAVWRMYDRAVVAVVDEGVGIPAERRAVLNAELANPRTDVGGVRSMGLHVVAKLAARHGIVVELRDSSGSGTIAEVTLPAAVVTTGPRNGSDEVFTPTARPAPRGRGTLGNPQGEEPAPRHDRPSAPPAHGARPGPASGPSPHTAPAPPRPADTVAGVSAAGLPVRRPRRHQDHAGADASPERTAAAAPPAGGRPAPRRRDSRQIADVLTAYAQGIDRSTTGRRGDDTTAPRTHRRPHRPT